MVMESNSEFSVYCKIYQNMSQNLIDRISKNCNYKSYQWPMYKKAFFTDNVTAGEEDWYNWQSHFQTKDWESDIWTMSKLDFEYYWPYHASFIKTYFEGANLFEEE